MATVTKQASERNHFDHTPYGNVVALRYTIKTTATGAVVGGNSSAPLDVGDVLNVPQLPAGLRMFDHHVIVKTPMTASVTASLGFAYMDGKDDASVPQDNDYFGAALNMAAAARLRSTTPNASVTLPKPAYLTLTMAGAKNVKAAEVEVVILAIAEGRK